MTPPKSQRTARGLFAWLVFIDLRLSLPCSCRTRLLFHALHRRRSGVLLPSAVTPDRKLEMSEAAVMPRGNAVAEAEVSGMVRTDGRNRRAAETRRKIIEAAKAMIEETSEAPTVVGVARRADVSVRSVFQHFGDVESLFVTVVDAVRDDLVVPPPTRSTKPLDARIESVVASLAEIFDRIVPLRVAAGQFVGHPALVERALTSREEL